MRDGFEILCNVAIDQLKDFVKTYAFHKTIFCVWAFNLAFLNEFVDQIFCLFKLLFRAGSEFDKAWLEELEIVHSFDENAFIHFNFIIEVHAVENKVIKFLVLE